MGRSQLASYVNPAEFYQPWLYIERCNFTSYVVTDRYISLQSCIERRRCILTCYVIHATELSATSDITSNSKWNRLTPCIVIPQGVSGTDTDQASNGRRFRLTYCIADGIRRCVSYQQASNPPKSRLTNYIVDITEGHISQWLWIKCWHLRSYLLHCQPHPTTQ